MGRGSNITAIVQNYYTERLGYWPEILAGWDASTVKPEEVLVWDNEGSDIPFSRFTIHSSQNTLLGRYAAAVVAGTDYIFVQDNDLVVGPETIERLYRVAAREPSRIVGAAGCRLAEGPRPYTRAQWMTEGGVDVVLGRCFLAHRRALLPGLSVVLSKNVQPGRADDIVFSMAAGGGMVVPCTNRNLDEHGVGLSHEAGHFAERDRWALWMRGEGELPVPQ